MNIKAQAFINILKNKKFKKVAWDKCPKGFKESNYQCFSHEDKNLWAEVYTTEIFPYMLIQGVGIKGYLGKHIQEPEQLNKLLKELFID